MITLRPVLEVPRDERFSLWPVAPTGWFLELDGSLAPAEVGAAVRAVAAVFSSEAGQPVPEGQVERFLEGMLTAEHVFVFGGLRMEDDSTGVVVAPGCCSSLDEWREWFGLLDGKGVDLGHSPSPGGELVDGVVRLTVDVEHADSPTIEVPAVEVRRLLAGVERDLTGFVAAVSVWAGRHAPSRAADLVTVLARALDVPVPVPSRP
ncbi:hypothetical protein [Oerskovia turbata]